MGWKALGQKIIKKPESFVRGIYSGIADTKNRMDGDGIVWTTGYVVGTLGPYGILAGSVYIYAAGGCDIQYLEAII